jgi:hypothetical protein
MRVPLEVLLLVPLPAWRALFVAHGAGRPKTLEMLGANIVPDAPSARVAGLTEAADQKRGPVTASDKRVFGTANTMGLQIITGDGRFVRAAAQGVALDARVVLPATFVGRRAWRMARTLPRRSPSSARDVGGRLRGRGPSRRRYLVCFVRHAAARLRSIRSIRPQPYRLGASSVGI